MDKKLMQKERNKFGCGKVNLLYKILRGGVYPKMVYS